MGLFKILDRVGGAGVKVDPVKVKPVAEKPKKDKPKSIVESIDRFAGGPTSTNRPPEEGIPQNKKELAEEMQRQITRGLEEQQRKVDEYNAELKEDEEKASSMYDEGYNDGFAAYSPVYDQDNDYMMGYYDGVGDQVLDDDHQNKAVEEAITIGALEPLRATVDDYACEQGTHKFRLHAAQGDGSNLMRCDGCGVIKHEKFIPWAK